MYRLKNLSDLDSLISPRKKILRPFLYRVDESSGFTYQCYKTEQGYNVIIRPFLQNTIDNEKAITHKEIGTKKSLIEKITIHLKQNGFKDKRSSDPYIQSVGNLLQDNEQIKTLPLEEINRILKDEKIKKEFSYRELEVLNKRKRMLDKKKETEENIEKIKAGDIFVGSYGYDETHVEGYQVISKKGYTLTLKRVMFEITSDQPGATLKRPLKDGFSLDSDGNADVIKKRLLGNSIKMSSYHHLNLWDGQQSYYTSSY